MGRGLVMLTCRSQSGHQQGRAGGAGDLTVWWTQRASQSACQCISIIQAYCSNGVRTHQTEGCTLGASVGAMEGCMEGCLLGLEQSSQTHK